MGINIALFEKESHFVKVLSDYMNERYGSYFEVFAFDDADRLLQFAGDEKCRLCFAGKGILDAFQTEKLIGCLDKLCYFVRKREEEGIYLFQSAEEIGKEIFAVYMDEFSGKGETDGVVKRYRKMRVIGFYSPARSLLQSAIALTMGQLLANEQKTLYLNFEPYSGFEYLMQKQFTHDLSDLIFYLKEDADRFQYRIRSIENQVGNLSYIPPIFAYPDLEAVDSSVWLELLQAMMKQTEYDVLILDLTEQLPGLFDLLAVCDEIYTCQDADGLTEAKMQQYEKMLTYMQKQEIAEKTKKFYIPAFGSLPRQAALFTHGEMADFVSRMMQQGEGV